LTKGMVPRPITTWGEEPFTQVVAEVGVPALEYVDA
jgi:hypothetical protein